MADIDSSLPIRTEAAGDVDIFISDSVVSSQKLKVEADGSINVNSSISLTFADDKVDASGSEVSLDAATLAALENVTVDAVTGVVSIDDNGGSITVDAVALDIRPLLAATDSVEAHLKDGSGNDFSPLNPLSVSITSDSQGDEICAYNTTSALVKATSTNHDYTVSAGKTLLAESIFASGSGKIKVEVLSNGVAIFTGFNSTANPNIEIPIKKLCKSLATEVVRITITNRDNNDLDVYSTLTGIEV